jgi:hypothetical protein
MFLKPKIGIGIGFGGSQFSPLSLFAASEPGFLYDPSDISTLFQDAAGTTPVTAAGQSVGLMLDKSRGLVLGPELVTNGGFDTDTAWTLTATAPATVAITGGKLTLVSPAGEIAHARQTLVTPGKRYQVTGSVTIRSGSVKFVVGGGSTEFIFTTSQSFSFLAPAVSNNFFDISRVAPGGCDADFDNISVRELPGNHATQSTSLSRPTYQVDSNGRGHLLFDGSDDSLVTPTITPGTDKAQVFAGVRKLSDAATGTVVELSASGSSGSNGLFAPIGAVANYEWRSRGSATAQATSPNSYPSPITNVLAGIGDIAADTAILRVNAAQAASSASDQGTGNYLAYPAYIGRRGGTSLPFNGRIYSLICRFGPNLTAEQIAQVENWVNSKTGAY